LEEYEESSSTDSSSIEEDEHSELKRSREIVPEQAVEENEVLDLDSDHISLK
jgi:hypothetical protein